MTKRKHFRIKFIHKQLSTAQKRAFREDLEENFGLILNMPCDISHD